MYFVILVFLHLINTHHRRARVTVQEREAESQNTQEAQAKREAEAEKRKKESHDLVAESIKRELAESMSSCLGSLVLHSISPRRGSPGGCSGR